MTRAISLTLVLLATTAALPAAAQDSGGLRLRGNPIATLDLIDANRGCPLYPPQAIHEIVSPSRGGVNGGKRRRIEGGLARAGHSI